jgi:hypothetical protein
MKIFLIYSCLAVASFIINYAIYNYSFVMQATPFLTEDQRMSSFLLMAKTTIPAYIIAAILSAALFYFAAKWLSRR